VPIYKKNRQKTQMH